MIQLTKLLAELQPGEELRFRRGTHAVELEVRARCPRCAVGGVPGVHIVARSLSQKEVDDAVTGPGLLVYTLARALAEVRKSMQQHPAKPVAEGFDETC